MDQTNQQLTNFLRVGEFHKAFGNTWYQKGRVPKIDAELVKLRLRLISEEFGELTQDGLFVKPDPKTEEAVATDEESNNPHAIWEGFSGIWALFNEHIQQVTDSDLDINKTEVADALADMLYVIYGMAHNFNIDIDAVFAEVHRSNMSKLGEDGKPKMRADGKILKGPNYTPPDINKVLAST